MKNHRLYISMLLFIFFSCQEKKKILLIDNFPQEIDLQGERINSFDATLGAISIFVTDDYWILQKRKSNYFFDVYSKKEGKKVLELGLRGQGPDDFLAPIYVRQFDKNNLWIFDRANSGFYQINIEESVLNNHIVLSKKTYFRSVLDNQARDMFVIDAHRYMYSKDVGNCAYWVYDDKTKQHHAIPNEYEAPIPQEYEYLLSQKMTVYNPQSKQFASIYFSYPKIEFGDVDSGIFKSIGYKKEITSTHENSVQHTDDTYFDAVERTDKYVYCLYNDSGTPGEKSKILVFDWDGNPICLYKLSGYYTEFAVGQDDKTLHALNYEDEKGIVTIFTLYP